MRAICTPGLRSCLEFASNIDSWPRGVEGVGSRKIPNLHLGDRGITAWTVFATSLDTELS